MIYLKKMFIVFLIFIINGFVNAEDLDANSTMGNDDGIVRIALATDSENKGYLPLENWAPYDVMDPTPAGCFLFVNDNDDDANRIPDFAQLSTNPAETNWAPLSIKLYISKEAAEASELQKIKVAFIYEGETTPGTANGSEIAGKTLISLTANDDYKLYPFSNTSSKQLYDYSPIRTGKKPLRIWNVLPLSARNPADIASGGNYVVTGTAKAPKKYTLAQLGFNLSGSINPTEINLYVEAINEAKNTIVKAIVYYDDKKSSEHEVKFTAVSGNLLLNTSNDSNFTLDNKDDIVEDQEDGFLFWQFSSTSDNTNSNNLENMLPIKTFYPEIVKSESEAAFFMPTIIIKNVSTGEKISFYHHITDVNKSVLNHLIDTTAGEDIDVYASDDYQQYYVDGKLTDGIMERSAIIGFENEGTYLVKLIASRIDDPSHNGITVDTALVTIKSVDKFVMLGSVRGNENPTTNYPYIRDDSKTTDINRYPDLVWDPAFATRQACLDKYLVFVHGFNNTLAEAKEWARVMFRRSYWHGFRGNFIAFVWHGDENPAPFFDSNVINAFQTSPTFLKFIKDELHGNYNAPADNISIMAHSLGNLVMWDMLRLNQWTSGNKLVKNILSTEPAVWIECFAAQTAVDYNPPRYEVDELKVHSWSFWFYQEFNGASKAAKNSFSGRYFHSYNAKDDSLYKMQLNDITLHALRVLPTFPYLQYEFTHYYRTPAFSEFRNPNNLYMIPALLFPRALPYGTSNVIPAGMVNNAGYANNSINAFAEGWRETKHSDHKDQPLYKISTWYEKTVGEMLNDWGMKRDY